MPTMHTFTFAAEKVAPTTARLYLATRRVPDGETTRAVFPSREAALTAGATSVEPIEFVLR